MANNTVPTKVKERVNWPITILLIIGLITIIFPLYMAVVIAFKDPSEMTNDIAGILSRPPRGPLTTSSRPSRSPTSSTRS